MPARVQLGTALTWSFSGNSACIFPPSYCTLLFLLLINNCTFCKNKRPLCLFCCPGGREGERRRAWLWGARLMLTCSFMPKFHFCFKKQKIAGKKTKKQNNKKLLAKPAPSIPRDLLLHCTKDSPLNLLQTPYLSLGKTEA